MEKPALDRLLDYLAQHNLKDGDALPPERSLAEALGMSRRDLRAALASMEAAGRVWRGVGRGTYLGARPLKFSASLRSLRAGSSPADIAEMRLVLEPAFVELATLKASPDDLAELEKCARRNATAKDDDEWQQWDHRFHLLIAQATRNPAIIALMDVVNGMRMKPNAREKTADQDTRRHFAMQHQDVVKAMLERDGATAAARMRDHLLNVQWRIPSQRERGDDAVRQPE
ncbi:GntR domain-containing protein (plasmid) [Burkholderia sp. YI23]|nr:FCD domain-containing protein [Caballeronia sp. CLC5]AET93567.1 GntR domain-containing protein [Burkholderia sp. YI23]MCE4572042.1 FCD domain-containing protein [Caballeronia sp. CLC5]